MIRWSPSLEGFLRLRKSVSLLALLNISGRELRRLGRRRCVARATRETLWARAHVGGGKGLCKIEDRREQDSNTCKRSNMTSSHKCRFADRFDSTDNLAAKRPNATETLFEPLHVRSSRHGETHPWGAELYGETCLFWCSAESPPVPERHIRGLATPDTTQKMRGARASTLYIFSDPPPRSIMASSASSDHLVFSVLRHSSRRRPVSKTAP